MIYTHTNNDNGIASLPLTIDVEQCPTTGHYSPVAVIENEQGKAVSPILVGGYRYWDKLPERAKAVAGFELAIGFYQAWQFTYSALCLETARKCFFQAHLIVYGVEPDYPTFLKLMANPRELRLWQT